MREKVNTAYFLNDPRKLDSMQDGENELNRLRAVCLRWKKKQGGDINITLGLSATSTEFVGKMGYDKPKNKGGKKQFISDEKIWRIDPHTGEVNKVMPDTAVAPHLHILVEGYGASSCAKHILQSMKKHTPTCKYSKQHLKTAERVEQITAYIEEQSTILRHV